MIVMMMLVLMVMIMMIVLIMMIVMMKMMVMIIMMMMQGLTEQLGGLELHQVGEYFLSRQYRQSLKCLFHNNFIAKY